ncbi:MAG: hypothetical protein SGARI_007740 [Bacillariaceae sp.]
MSEPIGFPVISSLMVAIKSRYVDNPRDTRDLGEIFVEQFTSIQGRYYFKGDPFSKHEAPFHSNLDGLQSALDCGNIRPNAKACRCLLYSQKKEWFTAVELQNPTKYAIDGDMAPWIRLSELMSSHYQLFFDFTLIPTFRGSIKLELGDFSDGGGFDEWATSCEDLSEIVDGIDDFLRDDEGKKSLWEYTGVKEVQDLDEIQYEVE